MELRSSDPLWWAAAIFLSLGSARLPSLFNVEGDKTTALLVVESALFLTGGLVGFGCPRRPWRWGVATFAAFALRDLAVSFSAPGVVSPGAASAVQQIVLNFPAYFLSALPVLVGAYLSAWISHAGLD